MKMIFCIKQILTALLIAVFMTFTFFCNYHMANIFFSKEEGKKWIGNMWHIKI